MLDLHMHEAVVAALCANAPSLHASSRVDRMFLGRIQLTSIVGVQAGKPAQRWVMTAENFLAAHGDLPIDEDEIREAVWELLFARAPPALVRVVGKQVYHR